LQDLLPPTTQLGDMNALHELWYYR
jgi:hypothetical protein